MSEQELNQYEGYLLNSKESVVSKTIKGTDSYYYFQFIQLLNNENFNLTDDQKNQLKEYSKFTTTRASDIKLRHLFLLYDQYLKEGMEEQKKVVTDELNKILFSYKFNQAQPSDVQSSNTLTGETKEIKSKLDASLIDIQNFFDKAYTSLEAFQQLDYQVLSQLNLSRFSSSPLEVQQAFVDTIGPQLFQFKGVPEFLKNYTDTQKQKNKNFELQSTTFKNISLDQLQETLILLPSLWTNQEFVGELYLKKFQVSARDAQSPLQSDQDISIRKRKLREIYQWTQTLPPLMESFSDQVLYELLQFGIETNDYDFDLFTRFLMNPKTSYSNANDKQVRDYSGRNKTYQQQWHQYHSFNITRWLGNNELINKYLEKYFQTSDDYQLFEQYLDKKYLIKLMNQIKLYKGEHVDDITKFIDGVVLKSMNDSKLMSICTFNKIWFAHGESVKLFVELKNIPHLSIKIFEFCTENFYLKNQTAIDNSINLDGLIASEQSEFNYTEPPIVKQQKEFTFEKITNKERGVFIVEFIGNGLTSRAVVKKGRLTLKEKITVAGHVYQILDEKLEVCNGTRTGLWINGRFYPVNKDNEIIVPFVKSSQTYQVVIVHEDFAFLGSVTLFEESYDFRCSFLYSTESMLMSSKAKILIQPKLYVNSIPASLRLLSEPLVTITTVNEHSIPSTMTFDKIKFNYSEEVEVEFPVAAKLSTIEIVVTAKVDTLLSVQNASQETKQDNKQSVSKTHLIKFNNFSGERLFCSQFLKFSQDNGYEIYVLGKNGEPKQGVDTQIQFQLEGYRKVIDIGLTTDELGRVILGGLKNVNGICSNVRAQGDISAQLQQWNIQNNYRVKYPNEVIIIKGDTYKVPFLAKEINQKSVSLYSYFLNEKTGSETLVKDLTSTLKLENGALIISDLGVGKHNLVIQSPYSVIRIVVLEGSYWEKSKLIITKDFLVDVKEETNQLVLTNVETSQTDSQVLIKANYYSDSPQLTRVHAFAVQFIPQGQIDSVANNLYKEILNQSNNTIITDRPHNSYYSNKRLSDEQKYVMDRRDQERYVGNTLEKPQFLLKRQFIRDTDMTTEQLQQEGDFNQQQQSQAFEQDSINRDYQQQQKRLLRASPNRQQEQVNTFLNFLKTPATVIGNQKLGADGSVTFSVPNNQHSTVFLVATNNQNVVLEIIPLKSDKFETRDLTQRSQMSKDKYYSIFRNQISLEKDGSIKFQDLTSTELQIVDSVPKLFTLLQELRKCNGPDSENKDGFVFWEFLKGWDRLDFDEKHKLFDKYQCDELNLFIFFKDRAYFETYVKQYISNKIEQSFVDHFLTLNRAKLLNYSNVQNIKELNSLEQVLLVIYLCELSKEVNDIQIAKDIVQYLESLNKLKPVDQREYKRLFDTVLEAKTSEGHKTLTDNVRGITNMANNAAFSNFSNMNQNQMYTNSIQQSIQPLMMMMAQQSQQPKRENKMMARSAAPPPGGFGVRNSKKREESEMQSDYNESEQDGYVETRKKLQQDFQNLEKTKEYAEKHYYSTKTIEQHLSLVDLNGFWVDLARHSLEHGVLLKPFVSSKFIHCNKNHTQMIMVLALMSLPFETPNHKYTPLDGKGVSIQVASSALVFTKEIKEGKADLKVDILVAQRFFDPKDRYTYSDEDESVQVEKDISEYIINKVYGCQVIVTNCSVTRYDFQVLVEVPSGSIPVETVDYTKSHNITLEPYTTKTIEFFFYFPSVGEYNVYPANVARLGNVVAVAKITVFKVNKEQTKTNLETMSEILSKGSKSDILNFVNTKNISNPNIFNFNDIYYLLKDKEFYLKLLEILRRRRVFDLTTWTYSLYHADHLSLQEFFSTKETKRFLSSFKYFKCSLFEQVNIRLLEYYPLVSQRVHQLAQDRSNILNIQFKQQYVNFIQYLVEKNTHNLSDKLVFIYYLLLQERINEAIQIFKTIDQASLPETGEARLQFDYFTAYLDFYIGFPNFIKAREVCEKYLDCPAIHWRNLFYEIVNQLTEYDGDELDQMKKDVKQVEEVRNKNKENADKEQILQLTLEDYHLILTHLNISEITIQIYKIDLEVLFSRNPFISQGGEDFAFVQPYHVFKVQLAKEKQSVTNKTNVDIPEQFRKENIFIQFTSGDKKVSTTYFSTSLQVQILEDYGQVKVQDQSGKYLSKIYVKTFAKEKSGKVIFYKDGYTDLRGRFDYASLNPESLKNVDRFAIFVMSDDLGSLIKEFKAPSQIGRYVEEVKLISKTWEAKSSQQRQGQMKVYTQNQKQYQ